MSAARAWAAGTLLSDVSTPPRIEDDALADAQRFGLDAATLDFLSRRRDDTVFAGVFVANAAVVAAFLSVASQWRTMLVTTRAGFRHRFLGLDYAGVRVALDALAMPVTPSLWSGIATMEQAAVAALNGEVLP